MSCDAFEPLLTGYVDGELSDEDRRRVEDHVASCPRCREALAELRGLKEELAMMTFKEPSDVELERYWASVYNRLERGLAWVLLSVGAGVLLSYAAFCLIEDFIKNPTVSLVLKIGVVALVVGGVVLFISLLRERLTVGRSDRYSKEVDR